MTDLNSMVMNVGKDLLVNTVAQMAMQATGLPTMLQQQSELGQALVLGHGYALTNDMVNWFMGQESKLMNGEYLAFEDEALFNSFVNYIYMMYDVDIRVAETVSNVSPFSTDINRNLAIASVGVLTNTVRDLAERNAGSNILLQRLVRPTSLLF